MTNRRYASLRIRGTALCGPLLALLGLTHALAAEVNLVYDYQSTVTNDSAGPLDLKAGLIYDDAVAGAPIAVVMHPYSGNTGHFSGVYPNADRLRDLGFFSILVAMRQREGSDGRRDSGGLEIYDIFDAVESVKANFPGLVDSSRIYVTGYSGGGGNTMSALTKFPDYFNAGAAFVGMSDYGYDPIDGWYFNGAGGRTSQLNIDVGDRTTGDPDVIDRYHARASNLASKNNPYSEIYLFSNESETISPIVNDISYRDNAIASAAFPGEFDNITFVNGQSGAQYEGPVDPLDWVDWNHDGVVQSNERQDYPHSSSVSIQERGELWFLEDLLAGGIPQPVLNDADELFVAGWVRTRPFQMWLGDGQNAAADLTYSLTSDEMIFDLSIASLDKSVIGELTIYENRLRTTLARVELNGQFVAAVDLSSGYIYNGLGHGDQLRLVAVSEPAAACLLGAGAAAFCCCRHGIKLSKTQCGRPRRLLRRLLTRIGP